MKEKRNGQGEERGEGIMNEGVGEGRMEDEKNYEGTRKRGGSEDAKRKEGKGKEDGKKMYKKPAET